MMKMPLMLCFAVLMPVLLPAQTELKSETKSIAVSTNVPVAAENQVTRLSPWAGEIAKLSEADIDEDVVLTFIDNAGTFNLDAAQIIRLRELGVANRFVTAMIQHDADIISGIRPLTISSAPPAPVIRFTLAPGGDPSNREKKNQEAARAANREAASLETAAMPAEDELDSFMREVASTNSLAEIPPAPNLSEPLYRVRAPNPEPITGPIIVFKAPQVPANTLVIEFSR